MYNALNVSRYFFETFEDSHRAPPCRAERARRQSPGSYSKKGEDLSTVLLYHAASFAVVSARVLAKHGHCPAVDFSRSAKALRSMGLVKFQSMLRFLCILVCFLN